MPLSVRAFRLPCGGLACLCCSPRLVPLLWSDILPTSLSGATVDALLSQGGASPTGALGIGGPRHRVEDLFALRLTADAPLCDSGPAGPAARPAETSKSTLWSLFLPLTSSLTLAPVPGGPLHLNSAKPPQRPPRPTLEAMHARPAFSTPPQAVSSFGACWPFP